MSDWQDEVRRTIKVLDGEIKSIESARDALLKSIGELAERPKPGPKPGGRRKGKKPGPKPKDRTAEAHALAEKGKAPSLPKNEGTSEPPVPRQVDEELAAQIIDMAKGRNIQVGSVADQLGKFGPEGREEIRELMETMYDQGMLNKSDGPAGWYSAVSE